LNGNNTTRTGSGYDWYNGLGPIINAYTDPYVVDRDDYFKMMFIVDTGNVISITFNHSQFLRNGIPVTTLTLLDDGTQGDEIANDSIFTINNLMFNGQNAIYTSSIGISGLAPY